MDLYLLIIHYSNTNTLHDIVKYSKTVLILISNFRRVLNAVLCLLGNLPASGLLHVSVKMYNFQRVYLPRLKPGAVGEIKFGKAHNLQYDLHFISVVYIKYIRAVYKIV